MSGRGNTNNAPAGRGAMGRGAVGRGISRGRAQPQPSQNPASPRPVQQDLAVEDPSIVAVVQQAQARIPPVVAGQFDNAEQPAVTPKPSPAPVPPPEETPTPSEPSTASALSSRMSDQAITPKPVQQLTTYKDEKFPAKPAPGTLGRPIRLIANHFQIKAPKEIVVHQYDVQLIKQRDRERREVKEKALYKAFYEELMKQLGKEYQNKIVYNFRKNLYSLKPLPIAYEKKEDVIKIENIEFDYKISKINTITAALNKPNEETIQVLDLIFTHNLNFTCHNVGRSFFRDDCFRQQISFNTDVWKGAYASVRPSEMGLTLNLDSANAAFMLAENVLDLAFDFYGCDDPKKLKIEIEKDRQTGDFMDMFRGRQVKTSNGFRKKIQGFGPNANFQFEMTDAQGKKSKITIKDYYKKTYNLVVKYPDLPCIETGREAYVPMEFCNTEARNKKKLSPKETEAIIKVAAVSAQQRKDDIQNWAETSGITRDPILKEYSIDVSLQMVQVDGRVLPAPDIQYSKKLVKDIGQNPKTMGEWNHAGFEFLKGASLRTWVVLNFAYSISSDKAFEFTEQLRQIAKLHGMAIDQCRDYFEHKNARDRDAQALFEKAVKAYKDLELILVILPGTSSLYKVCKTLGDLKYGIATQGVEEKNVKYIKDQTLSNILLKMNTKLGGTNFLLSQANPLFIKHFQNLYRGPLMIFGADVTHPSPGDPLTSESIAAVVGSLDLQCSYYAARLSAQKKPKSKASEMINDLDKMVKSLLNEFHSRNKMFPKKIIFYRDGVSEGQFPIVIRDEMNKIRAACQDISPGYKPGITFVVVQKRHHTRFFPSNIKDSCGKSGNVPPGTVVDTRVVTPFLYDFFLCSHKGIQGTSRPCRYFILHDDSNFTMDQIQLLSHYLCHIYSRCPRSVSYPAPAYYSHLAAFRGRDYNRPPPTVQPDKFGVTSYEIELQEKLRNKMFFT